MYIFIFNKKPMQLRSSWSIFTRIYFTYVIFSYKFSISFYLLNTPQFSSTAGGGESARAGESRASAGGGVGPRGSSQEQPKKENYTKYVTFIVTSQWGAVVHAIKYAENYEQKILIFIYVTRPRGSSQEQPKKENYIIKNFTFIVLIFIIICHMSTVFSLLLIQ